ncbi:uncharacterized protein FOMMEDRAFT_142829 [Fomitiporia mediterranea MF3/22]|uniref:uncharacterized protein n=1 Tax=Fomitiporia mediterranea (strain MF3/22) TaxID=694068 RepID=UPI0004407442|nr:uncharacterized protein FOMMEDRAFT_142829 [Fomitiporia mediterranea MF3/22]EJC99215.1 hypothetical protein FOMMEDRAFT_142829 [Fomitiporia mediterranea MF3/22]
MLASGWQDEIDAMRRMRERAGEVKLGPKPLIVDVYLKDREGRERWRDMKPISAGYIPSRSQNPVSPRNNSSDSPTDERRTLDSDTTTTESKSPTSPSSQAPTPQSRIRVSVLISMPTPQAHHAENNTDAPTKHKSNVSSGMEENKDKDKEGTEEARLGELNVALGITDVPVVQCKR